MTITLFLFTFLSLILRIIYVNLIKGKGWFIAVINLFGEFKSIIYFIPLKIANSENDKQRKMKKIANGFLYLFYIFLASLLLYGIFTELPHFQ